MTHTKGQGKLFDNNETHSGAMHNGQELALSKELLVSWRKKIHAYQAKLFDGLQTHHEQGSLFAEVEENSFTDLQPLKLSALPLNFWRWAKSPHEGPAIYLVMDKLEEINSYILLYIGETISADKRWKGEHDCKAYLDAYCEALAAAGITSKLSIRFWSDVPHETKARRKVEQSLIQLWHPPFNKETRSRWSTPFTTAIN